MIIIIIITGLEIHDSHAAFAVNAPSHCCNTWRIVYNLQPQIACSLRNRCSKKGYFSVNIAWISWKWLSYWGGKDLETKKAVPLELESSMPVIITDNISNNLPNRMVFNKHGPRHNWSSWISHFDIS